jgi:hypothetical protein
VQILINDNQQENELLAHQPPNMHVLNRGQQVALNMGMNLGVVAVVCRSAHHKPHLDAAAGAASLDPAARMPRRANAASRDVDVVRYRANALQKRARE